MIFRDERFETPNLWVLHIRLSSNTTIHPLYTKVTPQGAISNIITIMSNSKVRLVKGAAVLQMFFYS